MSHKSRKLITYLQYINVVKVNLHKQLVTSDYSSRVLSVLKGEELCLSAYEFNFLFVRGQISHIL